MNSIIKKLSSVDKVVSSIIVCGLIAASVLSAQAGEDDIKTISGETWGKQSLTLTNNQSVTSVSIAVDQAPFVSDAEFPQPIFHIDASDTNGWEFTTSDGKLVVMTIPSKTGNGRKLECKATELPKTGWTPTLGPDYVTDVAALNGGAMIDFGVMGSKRGLYFDADTQNANSNGLYQIGTIVAVWGSENGGGWVLGGGYGNNGSGHIATGYLAHRGTDRSTHAHVDHQKMTSAPEAALFKGPALNSLLYSKTYLDSFRTVPALVGFSGNWQTLSVVLTSANGQATGLGVNDTRNGYQSRSGGQQIAEMIFFTEILTDDQRASVEAYLMKKWFGQSRLGYNSRAELAELIMRDSYQFPKEVYATANVSEDETLNIGKMGGGLYGGSLTKTGTGTLSIGDVAGYTGTLKINEGTLAFNRRTCPDSLPEKSFLHLDASKRETLTIVTENGTNFVEKWSDVEGRTFRDNNLMMTNVTAATRPIYREGMLNGEPVVDFGEFTNVDGKYLIAPEELPGIATVFLVIGVQNGGGHLLGTDSYPQTYTALLSRSDSDRVVNYTTRLWNPQGKSTSQNTYTASMHDGKTFIDGVQIEPSKGFPHRGYHVVAARIPGSSVRYLACAMKAYSYRGGQRLAEVVLYNRVLTDEEFMGAQAYLMRKWLKRDAPGYKSDVSAMRPDVQDVTLANGTTIDVDGGETVVVKKLTASGTVTKTGDGTLALQSATIGNLVLNGGTIESHAIPLADENGPAAYPVFHVDAARPDTFMFDVKGGTNFVSQWHDASVGNNAAASKGGWEQPWLRPAEEAEANGNPVVDFGVQGSKRALVFDKPIHTIRSAYILIGTQDSCGGFLLGSSGVEGSNFFCFHRGYDVGTTSEESDDYTRPLLFNNAYTAPVRNGDILIDGVVTNYNAGLNGAYQLVEFHPTKPVHASAFAMDRGGYAYRSGGQRLGEVILYDRVLSERERVATRNYLMKKWLGKEPVELPAETAPALTVTGNFEFGADSTWVIDLSTAGANKIVIDGTCTFADPQKVKINNIDSILNLPGNYSAVVMQAGAFANPQALENIDFLTDMEIPRGKIVTFTVQNDNEVVFKVSRRGMCIIIR